MANDATPPVSLDAAIDSYLTAFRATKPSPHTVRAYRSDRKFSTCGHHLSMVVASRVVSVMSALAQAA